MEFKDIYLLLGRKAMTNLDSILKGTDITLLTNVHTVKTMIFPVVIYGCESWTTKKAEHQRLDAFELRCWRRLLRVPWIARRLNQSILKEINPEYSSEGLMLKLKFQYFGHLMRRADSLEKILMLGKTAGKRRRGQQSMRWLDTITDSIDMNLSKLRTEQHGVMKSVGSAKNWLIGKIPDAGKDWRQEEKGTVEDEMVGWHHQLNGHEFEQVPGVGDGQGGLVCCSPWGRRVRHYWATELNWTEGAVLSFPGGASGKEPTWQCRRHKIRGFDPWVRKSSWKRA